METEMILELINLLNFSQLTLHQHFEAWKCNIKLEVEFEGKYMTTENNLESFDDETIVEFKYDASKPKHTGNGHRLELDMIKLRTTKKAYQTMGMHFMWPKVCGDPFIILSLLKCYQQVEDIPTEIIDEDVYYNTRDTTITQPMRNFHNLYVKRKLINGASVRGGTIIDFAVGKAGDLPKWISAKQSFVFGIDISPDNIENRKDGACARYLNMRKKFRSVPKALFTIGNSSRNIRSGEASLTEKSKTDYTSNLWLWYS